MWFDGVRDYLRICDSLGQMYRYCDQSAWDVTEQLAITLSLIHILLLYVGYEAGRLAALAQAEQRRRRTRKGGSLNG